MEQATVYGAGRKDRKTLHMMQSIEFNQYPSDTASTTNEIFFLLRIRYKTAVL